MHGAMHGIPVLAKEDIDTAGGIHTTAGSEAIVDGSQVRDAFVAERLRATTSSRSSGPRGDLSASSAWNPLRCVARKSTGTGRALRR
jgi:hypothetical protein